jgi:hypothetical protein
MFVRFVAARQSEDSQYRLGVFHAAWALQADGRLTDAERAALDRLWRWFDQHLPAPGRLSRSRRPRACGKAICWFKDTAAEHLAKVRELLPLLERHGVATAQLQTGRPGYVVYEDRYQVAAVPFRDSGV